MQLGNRYSQHSFAQVPDVKMARSTFDRSHTVKDTFDFDYLVPCFIDEILPGDTANVSVATFARLATQLVPIMDNMMIDFFFFFVPNRLVWNNWEKFNGAQTDPGDSTDFTIPQTTTPVGGVAVDTIYDHMGIPTQIPGLPINVLPMRAYNLIWNEWFRDQNLQDSLGVPKDDGPDTVTDYALKKRGKRHDYFTSALPWPQKGDAIEIPIGSVAPVRRTGPSDAPNFTIGSDGSTQRVLRMKSNSDVDMDGGGPASTQTIYWGSDVNLEADLSSATAATINQLRQAFSVQSMLELDARGGTRYTEILASHFNVISPDFRLQRPEYLGGGQVSINSHPVAQTSPTAGSDPQAQLAAYATAAAGGNKIGFTKSFVEHGYVIGLMSARADITYQQGLERFWSRETRYDFFWPKLQEMGEQAILMKEIYATGTGGGAADDQVFGYQERYADYRYKPSRIQGQFRSTFATSLDFWHMAEEFSSAPSLNDTFIQSTTPIARAIAVPSEPDLLIDLWFKYKHARPMLTYSVPSSLGRF